MRLHAQRPPRRFDEAQWPKVFPPHGPSPARATTRLFFPLKNPYRVIELAMPRQSNPVSAAASAAETLNVFFIAAHKARRTSTRATSRLGTASQRSFHLANRPALS